MAFAGQQTELGKAPPASDHLEYALNYAVAGWPVFPVAAHSKSPLVAGGHKAATTDPQAIMQWWLRWPDANIAGPTGVDGIGYDVIDSDGPEGERSIRAALDTGVLLSSQILGTVRTAGGWHYYLAPCLQRRSDVKPRPGLDVRAAGGYVILPGSVHPSGVEYRWHRQPTGQPTASPLLAIDTWLAMGRPKRTRDEDLFDQSQVPRIATDADRAWARRHLETLLEEVACAQVGSRRNTLNRVAYRLARYAAANLLHVAVIRERLEQAATVCEPPLPAAEIQTTVERAVRDGMQRPWVLVGSAPADHLLPGIVLAVMANPKRWAGRTGLSDWAVLTVLLETAQRVGRCDNLGASVRFLIERTGLASQTVRTATRRLVDDGWLVREHSGGTKTSAMYSIVPKNVDLAVGAAPNLASVTNLLQQDAFVNGGGTSRGGLGKSALRILVHLRAAQGPLSPVEIATMTGLHPVTVRQRLAMLAVFDLVRFANGKVQATSSGQCPDLEVLAKDLRVSGRIARYVERHRHQRKVWRDRCRQWARDRALIEMATEEPSELIEYLDPATGDVCAYAA